MTAAAYQPRGLVIEIQRHDPEGVFAAGLLRDGEPFILGGALVASGPTPGAAADQLAGMARYLAEHGANFLTDGPVPAADLEWLRSRLHAAGLLEQP